MYDIASPGLHVTKAFPPARHKDWFDGHSWASGIFFMGQAKSQESTSEAVNAYYGVYLFGMIAEARRVVAPTPLFRRRSPRRHSHRIIITRVRSRAKRAAKRRDGARAVASRLKQTLDSPPHPPPPPLLCSRFIPDGGGHTTAARRAPHVAGRRADELGAHAARDRGR